LYAGESIKRETGLNQTHRKKGEMGKKKTTQHWREIMCLLAIADQGFCKKETKKQSVQEKKRRDKKKGTGTHPTALPP